jgi:asparagine synthase (glutamine-hydrolysing)
MRILLMRSGGLLIPPRLQRLPLAMIGRPLAPQWLQAGWFRDRGVTFRTHWQARGRDVLRERLHRFITEIHLPSLLRYADRNSMAYSVESRVPFLTPALASFAHALPEEHLVAPDGTTKAVLRAALRGLVPDEVLDRRDKIGFATPEREWLSTLRPWVETVLRSEAAHALPVFPAGALQAEWERVLAGRAPFDGRIWRWLNLIRWAELNDVQFA